MTEIPRRNRKEYSKSELILGNLAIILWITAGAFSIAIFSPYAAIAFFAAAGFLVFYELGKHGCQTCYYCKTCTIGMGKLPELFFKRSGTANVNRRAMRLFPFIYALMSAPPIIVVAVSLAQQMATLRIALLVALLSVSIYTGTIRWKNLKT